MSLEENIQAWNSTRSQKTGYCFSLICSVPKPISLGLNSTANSTVGKRWNLLRETSGSYIGKSQKRGRGCGKRDETKKQECTKSLRAQFPKPYFPHFFFQTKFHYRFRCEIICENLLLVYLFKKIIKNS